MRGCPRFVKKKGQEEEEEEEYKVCSMVEKKCDVRLGIWQTTSHRRRDLAAAVGRRTSAVRAAGAGRCHVWQVQYLKRSWRTREGQKDPEQSVCQMQIIITVRYTVPTEIPEI